MPRSRFVERMDAAFYPGVNDNWDDTLFRDCILKVLKPSDRVLDVGGGAGLVTQMNFKGLAAEIQGVDLDPRVKENPYLDAGHIADAGKMPFADETFDIAFADNVMEHLEHPTVVFSEIRRVLKPGGYLLFKTPNAFHYMPTIARLTPTAFHKFYNRVRGRDAADTFPTHYRANSRYMIAGLARATGFNLDYVRCIESRPEYLRIAAPLYLAGILYERSVNASPALERFRILLVAQLRKT